MPISPSSANLDRSAGGNCWASSHSLTCGRSSASANSRTLRRSSSCSSVRPTSMDEIVSFDMGLIRPLATAVLLLAIAAAPAFADATAFLGTSTSPSNRTVKGFGIGAGFAVVAFEFEYADTSEDLDDGAPSLRTGMGNVLLQTPFAIHGLQPYFTTGGGVYNEELATQSETSFGLNTGGGVKISLAGPIRARVDYRIFRLQGDALHDTV